ncbi:MAG: hypothetical protein SF123_21310 [Chloroflexota bacterium]|nr:hypothetical protein [Chloroflexota bacterium]
MATLTETLTATMTGTASATASATETETATVTATGTETATATATMVGGLTLIYADEFDQATMGVEWSLGSEWLFAPTEMNGLLAYASGEGGFLSPARPEIGAMQDVMIEVRFRLGFGAFQPHIRASETGSYSVSLAQDGTIVLYRNHDMVQTSTITPTADGWYTVQFSAIGDQVQTVVNDVSIFTFVDAAPLSAGVTALSGTPSIDVLVDTFALYAANVPTMTPSATATDASAGISMSASAGGEGEMSALSAQAAIMSTPSIPRPIAFLRRFNGTAVGSPAQPFVWELAVVSPNDAGIDLFLESVTENNAVESSPEISPDGTLIIFVWQDPPGALSSRHQELHVVNVLTEEITQISFDGRPDFTPSWSPDGHHIAYVSRTAANQSAIFVLDMTSPNAEPDQRLLGGANSISWSPDGSRVLLTGAGVGTVGAFGEFVSRNIIPVSIYSNYSYRDAEWSPDGRLIAVIFESREFSGISTSITIEDYSSNAVDRFSRTISDTGLESFRALEWSPDGNELLIQSANTLQRMAVISGSPMLFYPLFPFIEFQSPSWAGTEVLRPQCDPLLGDSLAFVSSLADRAYLGGTRLFITRNGRCERLALDAANHAQADYAPIRGQFAVWRAGSTGPELYLLDPADSDNNRVLIASSFGSLFVPRSPKWSHAEDEIAYSSNDLLYIYNMANGQSRRLNGYAGRQPSWSADDQWIAYINSGGDVSYVESDCNGTINCADYVLFATEGALENPAWSPDGNWMLVVEKDSPFAPSPITTGDFLDRLWLIRIYYWNGFVYEDAAQRTLLREAYRIAAPAWTPNSLSAYIEMQVAADTPPYITRLTRPTVNSTTWTPPLQQQALPVALPGGYPIVVAQAQVTPPSVPQNACIGITTQGVNLRSSPRPEGNPNSSLAAGTFVWIQGRYPFSGPATWYYGVSTADASRIGWFSDVIDETRVTGDCQIIWRTDDVSGLTPTATFTPTATATRDPNIPIPTPLPRAVEEPAVAFHTRAAQFGLPAPFTLWPVIADDDFQNGYGPNWFAESRGCNATPAPTPTATVSPGTPTPVPDLCPYRNVNSVHPGVDYHTLPESSIVVALCDGIIVPGRREPGGNSNAPYGGSAAGWGLTLRCFADDPNDPDGNGVRNLSNVIVVYNHLRIDQTVSNDNFPPDNAYQIVYAGQPLATTAASGTPFIHLDLQLYIADGHRSQNAIQLNPRFMNPLASRVDVGGTPRSEFEQAPYPEPYNNWFLQGRLEGAGRGTINFWATPNAEPFLYDVTGYLVNLYPDGTQYNGPNCDNLLAAVDVNESWWNSLDRVSECIVSEGLGDTTPPGG